MATPVEAGDFALRVLAGPVGPEASEKAKALLHQSLDALLPAKAEPKSKKPKED